MYYNLSKMSDDQITQLMDSISSAEVNGDESKDGDFDSDDDVSDLNFMFTEDELMIQQCLLETSELSNATPTCFNNSGSNDKRQCAYSSQIPLTPILFTSPVLASLIALSSDMVSALW